MNGRRKTENREQRTENGGLRTEDFYSNKKILQKVLCSMFYVLSFLLLLHYGNKETTKDI